MVNISIFFVSRTTFTRGLDTTIDKAHGVLVKLKRGFQKRGKGIWSVCRNFWHTYKINFIYTSFEGKMILSKQRAQEMKLVRWAMED